MSKKIALSLNSGGILGIMQLAFLKHLDGLVKEKFSIKYPKVEYKGLTHYIDYFGGSSAGAINTAALTTLNREGSLRSIDEAIQSLFESAGKLLVLKPFCITRAFTDSLYDQKPFERFFHSKVGDNTFKDIQKKVLITSFNIDTNTQTLFTNIGNEEDRQKIAGYVWDIDNIKIKDALLASTASYTSLPPHKVEYERLGLPNKIYTETDDGLFDPSPAAELIFAIRDLDKVKPSDILLISIGFGFEDGIHDTLKGGIGSAIVGLKHVLWTMIDSAGSRTAKHAGKMFDAAGGQFFPIELKVSYNDRLKSFDDSRKNMEKLIKMTEKYCTEHSDELSVMADTIVDWIEIS